MKYMWLKNTEWNGKEEVILTFDTTLFDPKAKYEEGKKEVMKVLVNGEGIVML